MKPLENKFKLALGTDFLKSFSHLPQAQQGKVRKFMTDFRQNPIAAKINFEPVVNAKDKKLCSVRIDQDYRGIILKPEKGNVYMLLWVDHHDKAYNWAKNKLCSIHPETGAIYIIETGTIEAINEIDRESKVDGLFTKYRDRDLKRIGVPEILIPFVKQLSNEADLEDNMEKLPQEVYEALFLLTAGSSVQEIEIELFTEKQEEVDTEDFSKALENDNSKRRFFVISEDSSLQEVLNYPLDYWRIFLHPSQRELVTKNTNGPFRVLGGAGTGKTIVAMHRAKHLVCEVFTDQTDRILFTTFTKNLALDIEDNLKKICPLEQLKKIEIKNLDAWAHEFLRAQGFNIHIIGKQQKDGFWETALQLKPKDVPLTRHFYKLEWEHIIQDKGIESREEYLMVSRVGSGNALTRNERNKIWPVFERYREQLDKHNLAEYPDIIRKARQLILNKKIILPYKAVIVDEAQDFSVNSYALIKAISCKNEIFNQNSLFLTGDAHQRIYGKKIILKKCGIPIIGRSKILRINYRTTEQTRKFAVNILKGLPFDDLNGQALDQKGYVSLLKGDDPILKDTDSFKSEIDGIVNHLQSLHNAGADENGICITARTNNLVSEYEGALKASGLNLVHITTEDKTLYDGIRISTMHRVKGLDFDHMILAGIDAEHLPLKFLYNNISNRTEKEDIEMKERSLLYVAITRARKTVFITWYGEKSPLLC